MFSVHLQTQNEHGELLSREMLLCCHQISRAEVIQPPNGQNETSKALLSQAHLEEESH